MRSFSLAWFKQNRAGVEKAWYLWPGVVLMAIYGVGGLVWSLYNAWWMGAAFTACWIGLLLVLFWPSRRAWRQRRAARATHAKR